jgi:hypothetical protein
LFQTYAYRLNAAGLPASGTIVFALMNLPNAGETNRTFESINEPTQFACPPRCDETSREGAGGSFQPRFGGAYPRGWWQRQVRPTLEVGRTSRGRAGLPKSVG